MFSGVYTALITPFRDGKVDFESLKKLIRNQYENKVSGIVPCGTTGESPTLSYQEHEEIIKFCVSEAKGKMQVIAGTGSNSTDEALHFTEFAREEGCNGVLIVSPYYNKPTQKGLYLHFKTIADKVDIPIVIYNIERRTGVNVFPETLAKLFNDCKNVVAVKEASGSVDQMSAIKLLLPDIELLSGDDSLALPALSIGASGVISVLSNILPKETVAIVELFRKGNINEAMKLHYKLLPLMKALFIETNPIPVKTAANLLGICSGDLRLPMCEMEKVSSDKLAEVLKDFGLK
jgi:4-hydroxy-tetrahydrodipicolinate synthase